LIERYGADIRGAAGCDVSDDPASDGAKGGTYRLRARLEMTKLRGCDRHHITKTNA
jgi:hypothetical protein